MTESLIIDTSINEMYPNAKMGILIMRDVIVEEKDDGELRDQTLLAIKEKYDGLSRNEIKALDPIQAYVAYYKKFGNSYHLMGQLESVLKGKKELPKGGGLLQTMFLWEISSMLLTAGHDLSALKMPLCLKAANGSETYESISGKEATAVNGDMMLCDEDGPISTILRGPDKKTRITPSSKDLLFSIYAPPVVDETYIKNNLEKLENTIKTIAPNATTEVLKVFS